MSQPGQLWVTKIQPTVVVTKDVKYKWGGGKVLLGHKELLEWGVDKWKDMGGEGDKKFYTKDETGKTAGRVLSYGVAHQLCGEKIRVRKKGTT